MKKNNQILFLFILIALIGFNGSCSSEESVITTCATSDTCSEVEYGSFAELDFAAGGYTYNTQEEFDAFYQQLVGDDSTAPSIDFNNNTAVVAVMGQQSSGCYAIRINHVETEGSLVTVYVTNYEPQGNEACSAAYVNPYYIATIPLTDSTVEFTYAEGDINDI